MSSCPNFKICIVGDGGVGKTTLLNRLVGGSFDLHTKITIGVDFFVKRYNFDGEAIQLQIWDLSGQGRFGFARRGFYSGAKGIIFVYDLEEGMKTRSLNNLIHRWLPEVEENLEQYHSFLVGNKFDSVEDLNLEDIKDRDYSHVQNIRSYKSLISEAKREKTLLKADRIYLTSAKYNCGIDTVFKSLAKLFL